MYMASVIGGFIRYPGVSPSPYAEPAASRSLHIFSTHSFRRNERISCYVTVRGNKAMELLEAGLKVKE